MAKPRNCIQFEKKRVCVSFNNATADHKEGMIAPKAALLMKY
jgi:hypothetical protein